MLEVPELRTLQHLDSGYVAALVANFPKIAFVRVDSHEVRCCPVPGISSTSCVSMPTVNFYNSELMAQHSSDLLSLNMV